MQSIFTFLLLAGASSFVVVHNHIYNMPNASESDKMITKMIGMLGSTFDMEFIGHMIINPNGYVVDGGAMDGIIGELDEDGEIVSWNANEEEGDVEEYVFPDEPKTIEDMLEEAMAIRKRVEGR
jgi:hypothetical protein